VTTPSKKDRMRPLELLVLSAIVAIFVGVVVAASTRDILLGVIFLGVAFILTLMTLAMLALSVKPDAAEKTDLDEQNHPERPSAH
jgi:undecaprenyl pyrophosphate phosphatase UppP